MSRIEKNVFISYRRTNAFLARSVYQDLRANGYDAFFDFESIDSGSFERVILNQIAARAHFIVILTPSALERCGEPDDWLRREIEYAIDLKRNIVPLMFEGFDFKDVQEYLTGKLGVLSAYNAQRVPTDFFDEAMARLRTRFLNVPIDAVLHPTPPADRSIVRKAIAAADALPSVTEAQLTAEQWFERGRNATKLDDQIYCYTEAIRLNPNLDEAYNNRGNARRAKGDIDAALNDYDQAILINPRFSTAYYNRANARRAKVITVTLTPALELDASQIQNIPNSLYNYDEVIADYNQAIELNPEYVDAYNNRGVVRYEKGDFEGAFADYDQAIRVNPSYAKPYKNRGLALQRQGDLKRANADFEQYLRLDGRDKDNVRDWIRANEEKLRKDNTA